MNESEMQTAQQTGILEGSDWRNFQKSLATRDM